MEEEEKGDHNLEKDHHHPIHHPLVVNLKNKEIKNY